MQYILRVTGEHHSALLGHLFPGDGFEAAALLLCGRRSGREKHAFTVHEIVPIPHRACSQRSPESVVWPTSYAEPMLERARAKGFAVVKMHSHPGGLETFSATDDRGDRSFFESAEGWAHDGRPHGSAVMLPDGRIFGRVGVDGAFVPMGFISVAGDDLHFWQSKPADDVPEFLLRNAQAFGKGTVRRLRGLSAAVVGCSGTGSLVVEQLHRLGIGKLVLVDHDHVEEKNLNRILHATMLDARQKRFKTDVIAETIRRAGLGTEVESYTCAVSVPSALRAVAECDVIFGCMDTAGGRDTLNRIATFYNLPYFDVGVRLVPDMRGSVEKIWATVNYLQPGGSSLLSRGVYTMEDVRAEGEKAANLDLYKDQVRAGYLKAVQEDRPAVISVNMQAASLTVNEFLARVHRYRDNPNAEYAWHTVGLHLGAVLNGRDGEACKFLRKYVGRGDMKPLLDRPQINETEDAA